MSKQTFLTELRKTGDTIRACVNSGVTAVEFDKLMSDRAFASSVNAILIGHELSIEKRIQEIGREKFLDVLINGTTVRRSKRRTVYDENQDIVRSEVVDESTYFPAPEWVIKTAMNRGSVEDALLILAREDLIPHDLVLSVLRSLQDGKKTIRTVLGESSSNAGTITPEIIADAQAALLGVNVKSLDNQP